MRERILGYFNTRTSQNNCWVEINLLFTEISNDINESNLFEFTLLSMIQENVIRFNQDENGIKLALEDMISDILNDLKSSAIEEMREELRLCEENEDYEGAIEWRNMINESINNEENE